MKARYRNPIRILLAALSISILAVGVDAQRIQRRHGAVPMKATAYSQHGKTRSGIRARRGVIAADPRVLPLGTKVKVTGAGPYDGHYVVADTGRKVKGRKIDVFTPSRKEAKEFGVQYVKVRVVEPAPPTQ